ncbi:agmatinase [Ensifer sp. Root31]|nr:agmatinase [Ensifer sp. Root31]
MPYSGARSFMRRRQTRQLDGVDYAILGVPYDLSTSGRPGARLGPDALRNASSQLAWGEVWPWDFDPFDRLAVIDYGDVFYQRGQPAEMLKNVEQQAKLILEAGTRLITLGGDHSVTYPLLKAHASVHGPVALIQFDAHRDTARSEYLDHGSFVRYAMDENIISPQNSIQIGIRTHYAMDDEINVIFCPRARDLGPRGLVEEIKKTVGEMPCYLTFDVDSVDPAYAPGTGTPVVDGLSPRDVIETIRGLSDLNIVGMDVVEVCPPFDHSEITALLGASIILEHLCAQAARRGP